MLTAIMWESQQAWTKEQLGKTTTTIAIVATDHDEAISVSTPNTWPRSLRARS